MRLSADSKRKAPTYGPFRKKRRVQLGCHICDNKHERYATLVGLLEGLVAMSRLVPSRPPGLWDVAELEPKVPSIHPCATPNRFLH